MLKPITSSTTIEDDGYYRSEVLLQHLSVNGFPIISLLFDTSLLLRVPMTKTK